MRRPADLDIGVYPNCVDKPYRHMFQKLRDISDMLDARVDELGDRIVKKHGLLGRCTHTAFCSSGLTFYVQLALSRRPF